MPSIYPKTAAGKAAVFFSPNAQKGCKSNGRLISVQIIRTLDLWGLRRTQGMGIDHGGGYVTVAEEFLNRADVITGLTQTRGRRERPIFKI